MKHQKRQLTKEYLEHEIFKTLDCIYEFYDLLSDSPYCCYLNSPFETYPNTNNYIYSSIRGTIDSIKLLLDKAYINNAFAIVRKYFDEILMDIYLTVYDKEQKNKDPQKILSTTERGSKWTDDFFKTPKYENTIKYFKRSKSYCPLFEHFDFDNKYRKIREFLDDNMHINSFQLMINNDNEIHNQYRHKYLNLLNAYICNLFRYHFASILYLNPHYFKDSTVDDYLCLGLTPPEDSEKIIAKTAQQMFDKMIRPHKKLALFLKGNVYLDIDSKY